MLGAQRYSLPVQPIKRIRNYYPTGSGRGLAELFTVYGIPEEKERMEGYNLLIYKRTEHYTGVLIYFEAVFSVDVDGVIFNLNQ